MSGVPWREALLRGHRARQTGDLESALDWYRAACAAEPASAEAQGALGLMLLRAGQVEDSATPLAHAVALDPAQPAFRMNLAELQARRGDIGGAVELVLAITVAQPGAWWAWERLGELQARLGRFEDAREHFAQALSLRPDDPSLCYKLARAQVDCGEPGKAEALLVRALRGAPAHEAILGLQAEILAARADWTGLASHARGWRANTPANAMALRWLARAQWENGLLQDAHANWTSALAQGPRDAEGLATLARLCLLSLEPEAAAHALAEAEALDPLCPHMLSGRAILAMYRGDHSGAESYARRSLAANDADAAAWKVLVQLKGGRLAPEELSRLHALESDPRLHPHDGVTLAFALGDCLDAGGQSREAFAAWSRANTRQAGRSAREGFVYDPAARERDIDAIIRRFSSAPSAAENPDLPATPVFIVGMPRSGTTLLESVLGAHPEVLACGERGALRSVLAECLALDHEANETEYSRWREDYFRELPAGHGARALTDKNPWNFDALGLITKLFPQARILHLTRDPAEVALSIFRNEFPKSATFATDLGHIAHYQAQYERLMRHWETLLPGRFITLRHEEMVADFETATRRVLAFCGLDWNESCRDFRAKGRLIPTMSTVQVRQPLGSTPLRAARYQQFL